MAVTSSVLFPRGIFAGQLGIQSASLFCVLVAFTVSGVGAERALSESALEARLAAGEWGPARDMAGRQDSPAIRDAWLQKIALSQVRAGARTASLDTVADIHDDQLRMAAYEAIAQEPLGGAWGGAAMADFDTLIELITSTVAPDSWDVLGGPGAIESFPTGVAVDPSGLMRRIGILDAAELSELHSAARRAGANREARRPAPLRKVSLPRLERAVQRLWAVGNDPDDTMRTLAGLRRVQYLLVYPETRDVVLAGPAGDWTVNAEGRVVGTEDGRPVVQLDDLVTVLRNSLSEHEGRFGCSIAPRQENLAAVQQYLRESASRPLKPGQRDAWIQGLRSRLGRQDIRVYGIDPRSRAARTIVEADYHMKLIGMGLEEGTLGVQSYLDAVELDADGNAPPMDVLRWWFTLNYAAVRAAPERHAFELRGPGVKVQSENELLAEHGRRVHTGSSDEKNQKFAHDFTHHFAQLAVKYPVYAELQNLFDLAVMAGLLRSQGLAEQARWQLLFFGDDGKYQVDSGVAPTEVESVVNYRLLNRRHLVVGVSGGVAVDPAAWTGPQSIDNDAYGLLDAERRGAAPDDVPRDAWWWD